MPARRRTPYDPERAQRVGRAIQVLRTELGLSRAELAERAGVSYSYLSEIETGKKEVSSRTLYVLADALGVPTSTLMATAETRVRSTTDAETAIGAPMAPSSAGITGEAPQARGWFGRARRAVLEEPGEAGEPGDPGEPTDLAELAAIFEQLSPEDRELLLDFARRLGR